MIDEGLQDLRAEGLRGVQEAAPLPREPGEPVAEAVGALADRRPVVVHRLVDEPEEVRQSVADLPGAGLLRRVLAPGFVAGLLRDPPEEARQVRLVPGEVLGPFQRRVQRRVEVGPGALAGHGERALEPGGQGVVLAEDRAQIVSDSVGLGHGVVSRGIDERVVRGTAPARGLAFRRDLAVDTLAVGTT
ncbi:hypothetical protein [Geodermatophilus sp. FMUSA9-8]|uniref:hypothetical protein n=1 Tax=Geodermatophilus sp. FMUSA9-8 TaxID=3120155 RepID=UPI00300A20F9